MPTISSRSHPIVRRYRTLAAGRSADSDLLFIEGVRLLADAAASGRPIAHVAILPQLLDEPDSETGRLVRDLEAGGTPIARVSASVLHAMSPARAPSGVVAIAQRPAHDLADLIGRPSPFVVALVDVQDPGNVGAAIRAVEAGGGTGMAIAGASADPYSWKALRGAMGSALRLPLAIVGNPRLAVDAARAAGLRVAAAVPRDGRSIFDADLSAPMLILMGAEGAGLDPSLVTAADMPVTIPMRAPVESLNVAVATALVVYAAGRASGRS